MFERFTDRARKVMALANQEAQRLEAGSLGPEHILLGIAKEGDGVGANTLKNLGIDFQAIRQEVEKSKGASSSTPGLMKVDRNAAAEKVLEYSIQEARNLNHNYVGTEHLLLGLCRDQTQTAARVLVGLVPNLAELRKEVLNLLGASVEQ